MASDIQPPAPAENPELLGHDDAIRTLEQALASGRLHHGWLFHGCRCRRAGAAPGRLAAC